MSRKIKRIVVHNSASSWGDVSVIRKWHVQGNGWSDIGYNAVILNGHRHSKGLYLENEDGLLEVGRGLDFDKSLSGNERGAHTYGFNSNSIGICLVGDQMFSQEQFRTLFHFCKLWDSIVPGIEIVGHTELNPNKTCPNFDVGKMRKLLKDDIPEIVFNSMYW